MNIPITLIIVLIVIDLTLTIAAYLNNRCEINELRKSYGIRVSYLNEKLKNLKCDLNAEKQNISNLRKLLNRPQNKSRHS